MALNVCVWSRVNVCVLRHLVLTSKPGSNKEKCSHMMLSSTSDHKCKTDQYLNGNMLKCYTNRNNKDSTCWFWRVRPHLTMDVSEVVVIRYLYLLLCWSLPVLLWDTAITFDPKGFSVPVLGEGVLENQYYVEPTLRTSQNVSDLIWPLSQTVSDITGGFVLKMTKWNRWKWGTYVCLFFLSFQVFVIEVVVCWETKFFDYSTMKLLVKILHHM